MTPDYAPLWHWMKAREQARIHKDSGADAPHSDDPVIKDYRFCNVRREDDRGTIWLRQNIRERFVDHPALWFMLCIARQINWPDTLEELIRWYAWPSDDYFNPSKITKILNDRKERGDKVYTGAYMIPAPSKKGADKQAYIAETVCGALWDRRTSIERAFKVQSLQHTHEMLTRSNGWGPFMAYQAVVDMRFTKLLQNASDVANWAAAGPGTIRGLNRLYGRAVKYSLSQGQALSEMRAIYKIAGDETGIPLDFSDVPNILCETDKYLRVINGEGTPRAKYVPGRGY
jgi:hypothetical protein